MSKTNCGSEKGRVVHFLWAKRCGSFVCITWVTWYVCGTVSLHLILVFSQTLFSISLYFMEYRVEDITDDSSVERRILEFTNSLVNLLIIR